jgi:enoyl-CoA hydratase
MTYLNDLGRRSFLKMAAAVGGASALVALPNVVGAQNTDTPQQSDAPAIPLQDVQFSSGAKLTIERRGQIVLFGINRSYIQNRIDPETFEKLAEAYYQYDHDPSLRAAILFGHGENFSRGIDVEGFKSLAGTGKPWIASTGTIDPLAKRTPSLTRIPRDLLEADFESIVAIERLSRQHVARTILPSCDHPSLPITSDSVDVNKLSHPPG